MQEETKANHAGMSIWSVGRRVYLNLNGPTLGISFETRWEGGSALPITRAQLEAGRSLTDYLRQKWSIEPEMCVTHGLASVNSKKHLIGHHVDWARGFPFSAYGLPDQYRRPSPAVVLFGFDVRRGACVAKMGELWAGVARGGAAARGRRPSGTGVRSPSCAGSARGSTTAGWPSRPRIWTSPSKTSADAPEPRRTPSGG